MKIKFLILVILGSFLSCKDSILELPEKYELKDKSKTRIEGQVLEYGSNKPLPYAKVVLRESIYEPWSGGGNYIPIDTFDADGEGNSYTKFKIYAPSQLLFKATIPQTFVICSLAS